jgi:integrase
MALTVKKVEALKKGKRGRFYDGHGLVLQVINPNNSSWLFVYQRAGRERMMGLGPTHTVSLKLARERAAAQRLLLLDNIDPLDKRRSDRAAAALAAAKNVTFAVVTQQYFAAHESRWTNRKWREQFLSTMRTYAMPTLGALPVAMVDEASVLKCLRPIWTTKSVTAARVRKRVEAILDYASASRLRAGDNPARWKGNMEHLLPDKVTRPQHHSALPYSEIGSFMAALRAVPGVAARALEFTILTAARTTEAIGARWEEIDLKQAIWTIPAERMKMAKEHRVPLSTPALALLMELYTDGSPWVFIGKEDGTAVSSMAMYHTLRRLRAGVTVHGMRACFSDWASECTSYPSHIIERSLAHAVGSAVERAYKRSDLFDKRRKLMEAWGKFCATIPTVAPAGAVVPLRSARS